MGKNIIRTVWRLAVMFSCLVAVSCNERETSVIEDTEAHRSVYYWKTTFSISPEDSLFLSEHDVDRIYLRMFDVDVHYNESADSLAAIPIATVRFNSDKPDSIEIVPTVFITLDALKKHEHNEDVLAGLIVKRALNMCSYNDLGPVREIQFDCDWTESTKLMYDELCASAKKILHEKGIALSGTIRLHQIEQAQYPFDRGVLMLYNTGAIKNPGTSNSIIAYSDVKKYLGVKARVEKFNKARQSNCPVIDFAYPTFCWGVAFDSGGKFDGIIPTMDFENIPQLKKIKEDTYRVTEYVNLSHGSTFFGLYQGETVRAEYSDFKENMKVKELVGSTLGTSGSNIIYHLDSRNLSRYESNEIEKILR